MGIFSLEPVAVSKEDVLRPPHAEPATNRSPGTTPATVVGNKKCCVIFVVVLNHARTSWTSQWAKNDKNFHQLREANWSRQWTFDPFFHDKSRSCGEKRGSWKDACCVVNVDVCAHSWTLICSSSIWSSTNRIGDKNYSPASTAVIISGYSAASTVVVESGPQQQLSSQEVLFID